MKRLMQKVLRIAIIVIIISSTISFFTIGVYDVGAIILQAIPIIIIIVAIVTTIFHISSLINDGFETQQTEKFDEESHSKPKN